MSKKVGTDAQETVTIDDWPLVLGYLNLIKVLSPFSRKGAFWSPVLTLSPLLAFSNRDLPLMLAPRLLPVATAQQSYWEEIGIYLNIAVTSMLHRGSHQKTWNLSLFRFCSVPWLPRSFCGQPRKILQSKEYCTPRRTRTLHCIVK